MDCGFSNPVDCFVVTGILVDSIVRLYKYNLIFFISKMNSCKKCQGPIDLETSHLSCVECSGRFHVDCIPNMTTDDFEYIQSSQTNWKCSICEKNKLKRGDHTPVKPISDKPKPLLHNVTQSENSDSDKSEKGGVKQKTLCIVCKKGYSFNSHRAGCVTCAETCHFKCVGLNKDSYEQVKLKWQCPTCSGLKSPSVIATSLAHTTKDTNGTLMEVLNEMKQFRQEVQKTNQEYSETIKAFRLEVSSKNEEFTSALNTYSEWIVENGNQIKELSNSLSNILKDYEEIRQENLNLKKSHCILIKRVNNLEQSAKDKTVEMYGIPFRKEERVMDIIGLVSNAIGFDFKEEMVDCCYRLRAVAAVDKLEDGSAPTDKPGGVIVRFVRKTDKERFIELRRKKRNLNTRDLGFMEGDSMPVYLNDSLTQETRKLFNAAKIVKHDKQYTYLWVKNGRIFMRKDPKGKVVVIEDKDDLLKLQ